MEYQRRGNKLFPATVKTDKVAMDIYLYDDHTDWIFFWVGKEEEGPFLTLSLKNKEGKTRAEVFLEEYDAGLPSIPKKKRPDLSESRDGIWGVVNKFRWTKKVATEQEYEMDIKLYQAGVIDVLEVRRYTPIISQLTHNPIEDTSNPIENTADVNAKEYIYNFEDNASVYVQFYEKDDKNHIRISRDSNIVFDEVTTYPDLIGALLNAIRFVSHDDDTIRDGINVLTHAHELFLKHHDDESYSGDNTKFGFQTFINNEKLWQDYYSQLTTVVNNGQNIKL
jgi:hypothetical protein